MLSGSWGPGILSTCSSMPASSGSTKPSPAGVGDGLRRSARRKVGRILLARGEDVGVVLITTSPSDIAMNSRAISLPRIVSRMLPLLHILQKKFSSRRPTSLASRFRLVV